MPAQKPSKPRSANGSIGVTARFMSLLVVMVLCLIGVALTGAHGLHQLGDTVRLLYSGCLLTSEAVEDVDERVHSALTSSLEILTTVDAEEQKLLQAALVEQACPAVEVALVKLEQTLHVEEEVERDALDRIRSNWRDFYRLAVGSQWIGAGELQRQADAGVICDMLATISSDCRAIAQNEAQEAQAASALALQRRSASMRTIWFTLAAAIVLGVGVVSWLVRSVLKRILAYSRFAARLADGEDTLLSGE